MVATQSIPTTIAERNALPDTPQRYPGSLEQYSELLDIVSYPLEYIDQSIIALSYATELHEEMVGLIIGMLLNLKRVDKAYRVLGSNHLVYNEHRKGNFQPDVLVIRGPSLTELIGKTKTAIRNPFMVVEIISESSRSYDYGSKLPVYRANPHLQYILYLEQESKEATLHIRVDASRWRSEDYTAEEGRFEVADITLDINSFYPELPSANTSETE